MYVNSVKIEDTAKSKDGITWTQMTKEDGIYRCVSDTSVDSRFLSFDGIVVWVNSEDCAFEKAYAESWKKAKFERVNDKITIVIDGGNLD